LKDLQTFPEKCNPKLAELNKTSLHKAEEVQST